MLGKEISIKISHNDQLILVNKDYNSCHAKY